MDDLKERLRANGLDECDEAIDRIEALEARIAKADALVNALREYVDAEGELGGSGSPEDHALIFDTWDVVQASLAAYREGSDT